jgi:hypothetical protein
VKSGNKYKFHCASGPQSAVVLSVYFFELMTFSSILKSITKNFRISNSKTFHINSTNYFPCLVTSPFQTWRLKVVVLDSATQHIAFLALLHLKSSLKCGCLACTPHQLNHHAWVEISTNIIKVFPGGFRMQSSLRHIGLNNSPSLVEKL